MNVLLLSAGRRVELTKYIKKELGYNNGKLISADISNYAPAIYFADKFVDIPPVKSIDYISSLIEIINKNKIDIVIPTIDTELLALAKNKKKLETETNAKILISNPETIILFNDKIKTANFFNNIGLNTPKIITSSDIKRGNYDFPLFIKPFNGSSSNNTFKIKTKKELDFFKAYIPNPIIQNFIDGQEFTVDVMTDLNGNLVSILPRVRLKTRGGEISKGLIKKDKRIISLVKKLIAKIDVCGPITVQCIKNKTGVYFIEVNPRFGGGAPLGFKVGANSINKLFKIIDGEELQYDEEYDDNILALRYDNSIFLSADNYEKY